MKKERLIITMIIGLFGPVSLFSQPLEKQEKYNIATDKVLYVIGYAHMDSEWLWDYPSTINKSIRNTMEENFYLFEKYPDYVFNFTGSRRYHMMKEYYPELYQKVIQYVRQGRWHISGSSVDEGEVNMSSSEALVRQVLYGNNYFRKEFGKKAGIICCPIALVSLPMFLPYGTIAEFSAFQPRNFSGPGTPQLQSLLM